MKVFNPDEQPPSEPETPLSMSRLRAAFARMLGKPDEEDAGPSEAPPDAATPEGIVEAAIFVGRPDDTPLSAEEIAAVMRDVTPAEVEAIIERLNTGYQEDGAAWRIDGDSAGYRLVLAEGLDRLAERFGGRVRSTRLNAAALECLAVIAYRQPIEGAEVDRLRDSPCASTLKQLVRRGLLRCDEPEAVDPTAEGGPKPLYRTTDRFLRVMSLASIEQLPRVEELDD